MVKSGAHPKSLRSLVVPIALVIHSVALWGGPPQSVSAQDAAPVFPEWCLLPRTPLPPALWTDDTQSASAGSQQAPVQPSQTVRPGGQSLGKSSDELQATDLGLPLMIPSTAAWQRMAQAMTVLKAEFTFPSLVLQTPLSPALWTDAAPEQPAAAGSETGSGSVFAASQQAPGSPSPATRPEAQPPAQGYIEPRTTDPGTPLMIPSIAVWQGVAQALTILHVEPTFPSLLPQPPSRDLWKHGAQPVVPQAAKGKRERWETGASQPSPVLLAAAMGPADQPLAQGQRESLATGRGQAAAAPQTPPTEGHGETATASQKAPTQPPAPGEKGKTAAATANQAAKSTPSEKPAPRTPGQPTSTIALQASAGELPGTPGGARALRDPFKLPPPRRPEQEEKDDPKPPGNRPPGSRGLLVEQLRLKGVVRDGATQKMIAVVTTTNNRAYFLREGEAVYDGVVSKITSDAVYFKGNIFDAKRAVRAREVVKTLSPAPGEVR
jgi:hypothetical protein